MRDPRAELKVHGINGLPPPEGISQRNEHGCGEIFKKGAFLTRGRPLYRGRFTFSNALQTHIQRAHDWGHCVNITFPSQRLGCFEKRNTCSGGHFVFFFLAMSSRYWRYHRKKNSVDALHLFMTLEWDVLKISTPRLHLRWMLILAAPHPWGSYPTLTLQIYCPL